jgi:anti-sigma factor RsiW
MSAEESHGSVQEAFSAFVEGELPDERRRAVEAHLAGCAACKAELETFRRTVGQLGALKGGAPKTFLPSIQQQIHHRSKGRFFRRRWLLFGRIPFEWISLVLIVAMLVYYIAVLQGSPTQLPPAP